MTRLRRVALVALAVAALVAAWGAGTLQAPEAHGAGRAPYGGRLRLPVQTESLGGLVDPHRVRTAGGRLTARLSHCQLFAIDDAGRPRGSLARRAFVKAHNLIIELVPGAHFHSGAPISASDVVASLDRVKGLGSGSPVAALVSQLAARRLARDQIAIELPPGVKARTVQTLLSRPEVSVLATGRPGRGHGCGAFVVRKVTAKRVLLQAFDGHPRGRPRLDTVALEVVADAAQQVERFVFRLTDVSFEASHRYPRSTTPLKVGRHSTLFAYLNPSWAPGRDARVRAALWRSATRQSLARYLPWEVSAASAPWPQAIAPTSRQLDTRGLVSRLDDAGPIVIAYPRGDKALGLVASVIRDRLRLIASSGVRIVPISGLTLAKAAARSGPGSHATAASAQGRWHIAVVVHDWAATDGAQAAWEAFEALGAGGLSPVEALSGRARGWADGVIRETRLLPLVHVRRPVYHRGAFRLVPGAGTVHYGDSYKQP